MRLIRTPYIEEILSNDKEIRAKWEALEMVIEEYNAESTIFLNELGEQYHNGYIELREAIRNYKTVQ